MALSSTLEFERDERNTFKVESSNRKVNIKFIDISLSLKFLHIVNVSLLYQCIYLFIVVLFFFNFLRNITYLFIRLNVIFKHLQVKKFKITLSNYYQYFHK